jgi:signal transduction histidine kinase
VAHRGRRCTADRPAPTANPIAEPLCVCLVQGSPYVLTVPGRRPVPRQVKTGWRPRGLGTKLVASYVALSAAITLASLLAGQYVHARTDQRRAQHAVVLRAVGEISFLAGSAEEEGFSFVLAGDRQERMRAAEKLGRADIMARDLRGSSVLSAGESASLDLVILGLGQLRDTSTAMFDDFERGHGVAGHLYDAYDRAIDRAVEAGAALERATLDEVARENEANRRTSDLLTAAIGLLAVMGAMLGGSLIAQRIVRPLVELRNAAIAFGEGRLDATVAHDSADEVGELASAFEKMALATREHVDLIERSQRHLEDVFASMGEILLVCDSNGCVTAVNAAFLRLGGYLERDVLGVSATTLFRNGATGARDELLRAGGGGVTVLLSASSLAGGEGGRVLVGQDLTERERLEAKLATAQKLEALGQVAGGVAHDFNNILGAVLGCSELALDAVGAGHAASADLRDIADAARRGARLSQQLLAFSRPQAARPQILSVNEALQSIEPLLARLAGARLKIRLLLDSRAPIVRVDATQLDQVLMNLVVNARDAMPDGRAADGEVEIRTSCQELTQSMTTATGRLVAGPYVVVEVRDQGTGMDPVTMARLFEPFFTTKGPGKGTGLGLATVARVVQQAGGAVALESALGHGTTFRVYLPFAQRRTSPPAMPVPRLLAGPPRRSVVPSAAAS